MIHKINLLIHITAGTVALIVGIIILFSAKGSRFHLRFGRYFVYLLAIVVSTGFLGWLFFRSNSFLLMLTILAGYNTYSGYRIVKLKENKLPTLEVCIPLVALATGIFYLIWLMRSDTLWSPAVIYPTLSGLVLVTVYDLLKFFVLHHRIRHWWLYEHIYKIISAFSAILSAFVGTVLPNFKPYSQIGPSTLCIALIIFFIWKQVLKPRKVRRTSLPV